MVCEKCGAPVTGDVCPYCGSPTYMSGPKPTEGQGGYEENEWYDVPDSKPETEKSDDTVWVPDAGQTQQSGQKKESFLFSSWFVILMLFFVPIIGCVLMWLGNKWSKGARIIITIVIAMSVYGSCLNGGFGVIAAHVFF